MGQPQVTVVIPVWNGERYLKQSVESILRQTFTDFELLIIDDGSTDGTAAIAQGFLGDPRVSLHRQANGGVVSARNTGLALARTELIAFLDADDVADPRRLALQVAELAARPGLAVLGSTITYFNDQHAVLRTQAFPSGPREVAAGLERGNVLAQPAVMLRKSMVQAAGGYRAPFRHGAEDYDLWLRLSERHALDNLPEALTAYRIHPDSLTHRMRSAQAFADRCALASHRHRQAGLPDPLAGLTEPLSASDLGRLNLSPREEADFMPALVGMHSGKTADCAKATMYAERAWALRQYISRGILVRHCLMPVAGSLRLTGDYRAMVRWLGRAFITEPLSTCWMLIRG